MSLNVSAYLKSRSDLGVGFAKVEVRYAVLADVIIHWLYILYLEIIKI